MWRNGALITVRDSHYQAFFWEAQLQDIGRAARRLTGTSFLHSAGEFSRTGPLGIENMTKIKMMLQIDETKMEPMCCFERISHPTLMISTVFRPSSGLSEQRTSFGAWRTRDSSAGGSPVKQAEGPFAAQAGPITPSQRLGGHLTALDDTIAHLRSVYLPFCTCIGGGQRNPPDVLTRVRVAIIDSSSVHDSQPPPHWHSISLRPALATLLRKKIGEY